MGADGNLYGTTSGENTLNSFGTVFKIDSTGTEEVLYTFSGGADGAYPEGVLVRAQNGDLYGTTYLGGDFSAGTVFRLDSSGNETVLHSFKGGVDGAFPLSGLVTDGGRNLYGTTNGGGAFGLGTVFRVDTAGREQILYSFRGGTSDGQNPVSSLVRDARGNLYGTTYTGGDGACDIGGCGTVFEFNALGQETLLHSFNATSDGVFPYGNLIRDSAGNLYGTASAGGAYDAGTVFEILK